MIQKQVANRVLSNLEKTANQVDALAKSGNLDPRVASQITHAIDSFSDRFHVAAFGEKSLADYKARVAKVLEQDSDEPYMKTFDNPNKVIQSDSDEPYMHKSEQSFNHKSMPSFDQDRTVTVSERDEYTVRDLSEWSESTKKQPSWERGPAGKSTKQGSAKPSAPAAVKTASKTWAP